MFFFFLVHYLPGTPVLLHIKWILDRNQKTAGDLIIKWLHFLDDTDWWGINMWRTWPLHKCTSLISIRGLNLHVSVHVSTRVTWRSNTNNDISDKKVVKVKVIMCFSAILWMLWQRLCQGTLIYSQYKFKFFLPISCVGEMNHRGVCFCVSTSLDI